MPTDNPAQDSEARPEHRLSVLMFTDLVGSSDLKVKLGDMMYATNVARPHNEMFRSILARFPGGREINYTGDGFFACFTSVADAVTVALLFHRALELHPWPGERVRTRIGIHLGQSVILHDSVDVGLTITSHAADMCARLMSLGSGGQTLLTRHAFDDARQYVRAHPLLSEDDDPPPIAWAAHGPYLFKGKDEPLEVFEVGAVGSAPLSPPGDAEKARRAIRPGEEETLGWRPAQGVEVPGRPGWNLVRKLGEGGFGEVWLAEQERLKQERVFKFCFDEDRLRSFKRELTFFRLIRDALGERTDIARLYDLKLDAPPFFLESEFARQGNLLQWCERQGGVLQVPLERRLQIVAAVAEAVAAAHSVGILHKDIKPQNVLMQAVSGSEDIPQLTDFGIGALADASALQQHDITAAGFTVNSIIVKDSSSGMTRLYAPPEQLAGKPFTMQGDVYALGVMLYQIIVGDFSRSLAAGWERDVSDELLRRDIAECVDGDPSRRFADASRLADRLTSLSQRRARVVAEQERQAQQTRRRRVVRVGLFAGMAAVVVAVGLSIGLLRERELRFRANEAEGLATSRLTHAQQARDAAEKLVSEAIFGLREKLAPIGKISAMEDLAVAAEDYYAKLPADLVSDQTRRHQIWLALNHGVIAEAKGEVELSDEKMRQALSLAVELSAKSPSDEGLREDQYFALFGLAMNRTSIDRIDDALEYAAKMRALSEDWLKVNPKSVGALRAKLVSISFPLITQRQIKNPASLLPVFGEAKAIADQIRAVGGETFETRLLSAVSLLVQGMMTQRLGQQEAARKLFDAADAEFRKHLDAEKTHPLVQELSLVGRKFSVTQLREFAIARKDEALEKEAHRQSTELLEEMVKLAEFEPARLERWRSLAWACNEHAKSAAKFDGNDAWLATLERGLAAADRARKPNFDSSRVQSARVRLRLSLAQALDAVRPPGWEARLAQLLPESGAIQLTEEGFNLTETLERWTRLVLSYGPVDQPAATLQKQAGALFQFCQTAMKTPTISAGNWAKVVEQLRKVVVVLKERKLPEAEAIDQQVEAWMGEFAVKFANDPMVLRQIASNNQTRGFDLLNEVRKVPVDQRQAPLETLQAHVRKALEFLAKERANLPEPEVEAFIGAAHAAWGTGLLEAGRFAEAEAELKLAVEHRQKSSQLLKDPVASMQRRWDAADSMGRLGQVVFAQGRQEEGRKLRKQSAEEMTSMASAEPSILRHREAAFGWRRYADQLPQDGSHEDLFTARKNAVDQIQLAKQLATVPTASINDKTWCNAEVAWCNIDLAKVLVIRQQPDEALAALKLAVASAESSLPLGPANKLPDHLWVLASAQNSLACQHLKMSQPEAAKPFVEQLATHVKTLEPLPDPYNHLATMRRWIQDLNSKLGNPTETKQN